MKYFRTRGGSVLHRVFHNSPETACGRSIERGYLFSIEEASPDVRLTKTCTKCNKEAWSRKNR